MGTKYSSTPTVGYNSSPPADDGSAVGSNQVKWNTVKTKVGDPLNTFAGSIDTKLVTALDLSMSTTAVTYTTTAADHLKPVRVTAAATVHLGDAATMAVGYQTSVVNMFSSAITVDLATAGNKLNTVVGGSISLLPGNSITVAINQAGDGYDILSVSLYDQAGPIMTLPSTVSIPANTLTSTMIAALGRMQVLTGSGNFTPSKTGNHLVIRIGGGGGGGSGATTGATASCCGLGGCGGGGGEYRADTISLTANTPVAYVVGGGGLAGAQGSDTTFAGLTNAAGGKAGNGGTMTFISSTGATASPGGATGGGYGGGVGGAGVAIGANGNPGGAGVAPGAGGGGGSGGWSNGSVQTGGAGAAGANGTIIVIW